MSNLGPLEAQVLLPPPAGAHDSFEDAIHSCQNWAKEHGYAVTKANTKEYPGGPYTLVFMQCDRGDKYKERASVRKSRTRVTECPFRLRISPAPTYENRRQCMVVIINPSHNHTATWSATAHPVHRRLHEGARHTIRAEARAGVKPKQILVRLQQETPGLYLTKDDIYNELKKARTEQLQGLTPIEALIQQLKDTDKWVFDYQTDSQGHLTYLFLAYVKTVQIFQSHPDILMADCTYRTNRFKMPLLHFLGCNSIGGHFTAAFCFLPSENQADYLWAVGCIQRLLYEPIKQYQAIKQALDADL